jgi:tetratricopeptide (TPR) repeat protein
MPTGRDNRRRGESETCATQRKGCGQCTPAPDDSAPSGRQLVGWRKWLLRIVLLVVSPLAVLAILEGVLWVAGFGYPTGFLITPDGGATWTENPRFAWRFSSRAVASEPEPIRLAGVKPAGTFRIVVLGESAAYGTPEPAYNFGRILQTILRERHPGMSVEVVNAAVMGISSHAIVSIARDCVRLSPDVFVVYMGNNEVIGPWSPFTAPACLASHRSLIRAGLWAKATRVGQWVESVRPAALAERQGIETFVGVAITPGDPRLGIVHDHFRANLEEILHIAHGAGVRVVAATVATNLRDFAPLASLHRTDLGADELATWDRCFAAGAAAERNGRLAEAVEYYRQALAADDGFAEAQYRLGRCLLALGRNDEARRHFTLARDFDALPFRAVGPLNSIIRDVAAGREAAGVYLVDAEAALAAGAQPWGGIPGEESFYEHCHLNFVGNYRLASAMLPAVEAAIGATVAVGQVPSVKRCAELLAFTEWDAYRMDVDVAKCMAKPPFTGKSDYAERLDQIRRQAARLAALETPELVQRQIRVYEEAVRRYPDDYYLHHKFALLKTDTRDAAGAAAEWREVLRIMPHNLEARVCLGDALARQGRTNEAVALWNESLRDRPGCLHAIGRLAGAMAAEGKLEEAAGLVEQAIEVCPDAGRYGQLGSLLTQQGKTDEAIEQYRRGLGRFPDDIGLRQSLAEALAAKKEHAAAAAEFEAVLRADPDHIAALGGLARALGALGRTDEAATHWRVALALNPAFKEAREQLGRLPPGAGLDPILNAAKMDHIGGDTP